MDRTKILSKALQKNQAKIEKETEWTKTHQTLPEESSSDDDSSSSDEEGSKKMSGKRLLIKIYGGCDSCNNTCGATKRTKKVYKDVLEHLSEHLHEPGKHDPRDVKQSKMLRKELEHLDTTLIPADKAPKSNPIWKFSNPKLASANAKKVFGKDTTLYLSSNPKKKYQIQNDRGEWVRFGHMGYQDWLVHQDPVRRHLYLQRAKAIKGDWKNDPYSANRLAIHLLWN